MYRTKPTSQINEQQAFSVCFCVSISSTFMIMFGARPKYLDSERTNQTIAHEWLRALGNKSLSQLHNARNTKTLNPTLGARTCSRNSRVYKSPLPCAAAGSQLLNLITAPKIALHINSLSPWRVIHPKIDLNRTERVRVAEAAACRQPLMTHLQCAHTCLIRLQCRARTRTHTVHFQQMHDLGLRHARTLRTGVAMPVRKCRVGCLITMQ